MTMDEFDPLERRLRSASDDVRQLTPDAAGRFESVRRLVRRRAVARRVVAGVATLVLVAGAVVLVGTSDDEETRLATDGGAKTTTTVKKTTTTTVGKTSETTQPTKTTTTSEPKSAVAVPEKTTTSTTAKQPTTTFPPKTTTTTTVESAGPPAGYVASRLGEVQAVQGSSCWRESDGQPALCADVAGSWADDAPVVEVSTTDYLKVRWATKDQPKAVEAYVFTRQNGETDYGLRQDFSCSGGNPCKIALTLAPGEYVLMVTSFWAQGDVSHGVRLMVR
jgi:hypothetical protein